MAQVAQLTTAEYTARFNDQMSQGANAAAQAMEKLGQSSETVETRARRVSQSFEALEARLDSGARMAQAKARADETMARQIERVNLAVERGQTTQQRANELIARANTARDTYIAKVGQQIAVEERRNQILLGATNQQNNFAAANDNATRSSGRFGQAMGQAGFQIQDFATQVSMGQNALTAFGVQFAQFAGIFGTGGAIAGAVVTVGLLASQFLLAGESSEKEAKRIEENFAGMKRAAEEVKTVIEEINALFLTAAERSAAAANRQSAELASNAQRLLDMTIQRNEGNALELTQAQQELRQAEERIARRDAEIRARTGSRANEFQRQDEGTLFPLRQRIAGLEADITRQNSRIGELLDALNRARNAGVVMPEEANMPPAPERERGNRDAEREALRLQREAERDHQRIVQQGVSLAESAATENEKYEAQVRALAAALSAGQVSQERYNRAVEQLSPAMREARQAEERALQERERLNQRTTDEIVRYSADRFADLWSNTGRGFAGLMESLLQMVRRTFARIAAEAVIRPIVTPIVSSFVTPIMGALGFGGGMAPGGASAGGGINPGQVLQAGQAISSAGSGAGGLGGLGGFGSSAAAFLSTPIWTSGGGFFGAPAVAAPSIAGMSPSAAMAGLPATPTAATTGLGASSMTFGSALGAGAAGFSLGMMGGSISGGLRGTADPTAGSAIGSAIGMAIGTAILPGIGTIVGGALGGTVGGLFGPTNKGNASRAGGDVFLGVDANGQLTITGARGKRWDQGGATAAVQEQLNAINAQTSARGLTFAGPGQAAVGFGQASGSPRELSLTALVGQLRSENANQMTAFGTLAGRGAGLEEALSAADFVVQIFEPLGKAVEKTSAFKDAMEALTKTYDDAITRAKDLGLAETDLQTQRAERVAKLEADRARDLDIIDRTLAARRMVLSGDNRNATLTQFDLRAEAELRAFREQLFQYGLEETGDEYRRRVVTLEQTIADERLAVIRQFDQQMRGISQGLLESLTLGDLGGLPLEARYGAALSSLSAAQRPLLDGATPEELAEFSRVAQIALPIAKEFLGVSGSFAELVADVARTLRTAAPGSDPANLGALLEAQVAGSDRLELAVISTGNMQTEVLRNLLTELRRLTAQNEALLARASV
jgi:hypothetical protein